MSQSLLLAECKRLIDSNHDRKSIKICINNIYIGRQLHAKVVTGSLQQTYILHNQLPPNLANSDPSNSLSISSDPVNIPLSFYLILQAIPRSHCCLRNCTSYVTNKIKLLQLFVYVHSFDIIALNETWLTDKNLEQKILPTDYSLIAQFVSLTEVVS